MLRAGFGQLLTFTGTVRAPARDWLLPFGSGESMSAVTETGRSGLAQAVDCSTLKLDVRVALTVPGSTGHTSGL